MLSKYTYKQRFTGLVVLLFLLTLGALKKLVIPSVSTINSYYSAKSKIENATNLDEQLAGLTVQNQELDRRIGSQAANPVLVQNAIVEFIAERNNNIKLKAFKPMHSASDAYFTVYSNHITLQGGINEVLATLYELETQFELSKLAHVRLNVQKNYKTRKNELFSELLFRQYEKN